METAMSQPRSSQQPNSLSGLLERYPIILQLLRFAAIGILNTSLDFIVLNLVTKTLGIESGLRLGSINIIGFSCAVVQSYFWNRHWSFSSIQADLALLRNAIRLILVGGLGLVAMIAVLYGARIEAHPVYYLIVLVVFLMTEIVFWFTFGLNRLQAQATEPHKFFIFLVVSVVGLSINSGFVALISHFLIASSLAAQINVDLIKNLAKILATAVSMVWDFSAYKFIVFKK